MTFPSTIDIDALLTPISEESPAGVDIRADRSPTSDYYFIKDARNNARAAERNAMFDSDEVDLITPWREVATAAQKILHKQSKDLEVASWYTEALIRTRNWAGLRDGVKLLRGLIDNFWEGLYPRPDEDGIETKVAPLTGLNGDGGEGTLIAPLRNTKITEGGSSTDFSVYQYQQARDAERIVDDKAKQERLDALGYGQKDVDEAIAVTQDTWCANLVATLEETIEDYKAMVATLRQHCGNDAPPSSNITKILDEILRTVRHIYQARLEALAPPEAPAEETQAQDSAAAKKAPVRGFVNGAITSREDALRALEQVAKYFRQYEPHTPIAAGVERIVTWGRMTVAELMMQLLPDDNARATYSALTGVKLDGTDTATYVPPPVPTNSGGETPNASKGDAKPNSEWGGEEDTSDKSIWL